MADEVVVVDSGSVDRSTCEIAAQAGASVLRRAFTDFGDQKKLRGFPGYK